MATLDPARVAPKANRVRGQSPAVQLLTTEPNAIVLPVHQKAMPVILTEDTWDAWLALPTEEALKAPAAAPLDWSRSWPRARSRPRLRAARHTPTDARSIVMKLFSQAK